MQNEIKYGGYSASPNDHGSIEGDLHVAMNLVPEDGTIKPVLPPKELFALPDGYAIVCIHDNHFPDGKHYICRRSADNALYRMNEDGTFPEGGGMIHAFGDGVEVHSVEPVGNTLVVLTDDGIHYILWKQGAYHYLGNHLPELDLSFSLVNIGTVEGEEYKMVFDELKNVNTLISDKEQREKLRETVLAAAASATATAFHGKKLVYPFFVRYAFRLYDGSITMHSAPRLMMTGNKVPEVSMQAKGIIRPLIGELTLKAEVQGYALWHCVITAAQVGELERWKDIISSVDVFISTQFYRYDTDVKKEDLTITEDWQNSPSVLKITIPDRDISKDVINNANFYLVRSIPVDKIFTGDWTQPPRAITDMVRLQQGFIKFDFEPNNDNISVRESMTDDYDSHDTVIASQSFAFNARINIAGLSKRLFCGFNPACMFSRTGDNTALTTRHTVVVETDGREIVLQSPEETVIYDSNGTVLWYYYPNINAKRVYVRTTEQTRVLTLLPHPMLNGAYYCSLEEDAQMTTVNNIPALSSDDERVIKLPNKVYTSEVNNPFYFPSTGINTVGAGEIIGMCAAVKALSQGQFGQFPLYAFTTEGVWALQTTGQGGYSSVQPVTRDVCLSAGTITQLDDSVLFTTARGIMLISGSQVQCISVAIDDGGAFVQGMTGYVDNMAELNGLGVIDVRPFREFLPHCRMTYDYKGQRIIVYNPHFPYAYIYSLESHKWGMMQSSIVYTVNAYPDALAVVSDDGYTSCLVNYSEQEDTQQVNALLVTRPLSLDLPDVLKTVNVVLQRGLFRHRSGHVKTVLYGSRDLFDWHLVASSTDESLRGFSGTPYKWYRVALLLQLPPGESVTGCSVQFDPRYQNRLR